MKRSRAIVLLFILSLVLALFLGFTVNAAEEDTDTEEEETVDVEVVKPIIPILFREKEFMFQLSKGCMGKLKHMELRSFEKDFYRVLKTIPIYSMKYINILNKVQDNSNKSVKGLYRMLKPIKVY